MSARKTKLIPLTDLSQHSDGEFSFQSGEMESPADSTSDNVPVTETIPVKPKLKKRGSSGLANLQKARMKKTLRRERMRTLLQQRAKQKKQNGEKPAKVKAEEPESSDGFQSDYFLGKRKETNSEKLVIALRLSKLVKKLHEGANVCKTPPAPIKDETQFPILNMIRSIGAWIDTKKNPVEWSSNEAFFFVKQLNIPDSKIIAKMFRSEEIDGEALLNLSERDLTHRFQINPTTSSAFIKVFTGLREEVIKRYINF